jgi:hypothetical protein
MDLGRFKPTHVVQKWGWASLIIGIFLIPSAFVVPETLASILISSAFYIGVGLFLVLAKGPQNFIDNRRKNKAEAHRKAIESALAQLEKATGAKAFIAYEKLEALVNKKGASGSSSLSALLDSINFDKSRIDSRYLGALVNPAASIFSSAGRQIRIYQEWVIAGDLGYDFDVSTRGNVTVDGSIQFDKKNNKVDTRTATLQLATQEWSHAFRILPDEADEARRILNHLLALVEEMKPKGVTSADIKDLTEKLLASSGKSPAEKLEELSNLRYQRLLSDQEFESAKSKILGI